MEINVKPYFPESFFRSFLSLLSSCATLPTHYVKESSKTIRETSSTWLGQRAQEKVSKHPGESGFYVLSDGIEALAARLNLASHAEVSIDVQYYFAVDFARLNHRMHNKSITFDNLFTIIGGRNIGTEYFEANNNFNYRDLDVVKASLVRRYWQAS